MTAQAASDRGRGLVASGCVLVVVLALGACSSGGSSASTTSVPTTSTTTSSNETLQVLVTNDDGVSAPGIDAAVQALRALAAVHVTVVAPLANQSGTGGKTTTAPLTVTDATTASGYPAKAVHGYPADTVVWAIDDHGVATRPDLVVSGINAGENVGPLTAISGTVGAARAAVARGVAALAASQGIDDRLPPAFDEGAHALVAWVRSHRADLLAGSRPVPAASLNVPTCPGGKVRGPVEVPVATSLAGLALGQVDCSSTATRAADDAHAFVVGLASLSPLGTG